MAEEKEEDLQWNTGEDKKHDEDDLETLIRGDTTSKYDDPKHKDDRDHSVQIRIFDFNEENRLGRWWKNSFYKLF